MKVIFVHNYYRSDTPSGENSAVDDELNMLPQFGADVLPLTLSSDDLLGSPRTMVRTALKPVFAPTVLRQVRHEIARFRPDIMHIHNVFPRFGPTAIAAARAMKVPVVQTVHNRRMTCMAGTNYRDGHQCTDCLGRRVPLPGVLHACYRGSTAESLIMASSAARFYPLWRKLDHYFAVGSSIAESLVAGGVPRERITVKANPVRDPGVQPMPELANLLYAGRLDEVKGVALL